MSSANYIQENTSSVDTSDALNGSSSLSFNIESELNTLGELILDSTNIPLTELTIVDRNLLLHQLNLIKENLPIDLATAIEIANCRQQIISEAESYALLVVKSAEEKAHQILQDSAIVRQAELDGAKIRLKTERECEELKQTIQNEVAQLRQNAIAECQSIQIGADNYADDVLGDIEQRLQQMLEIIQNGRQQLDPEQVC
ncbi:MAG: DivIVA domain-containing protein [Waterburya sp.]